MLYNETKNMESYPLMFLSMLATCLLVFNHHIISVSGRRNDKWWSKPFDLSNGTPKFHEPEIKPNTNFALTAFHPDDLKQVQHPVSQLEWDDDHNSVSNKFQPPKFIDLPFAGVKFSTSTLNPSLRNTYSKSPSTSNEIHVQIDDMADLTTILGNSEHYQDIILSIDQSNSKPGNNLKKEEAPKPFWGPPIETRPTPWPAPNTKATLFSVKPKTEIPIRLPNNFVHTQPDNTPGKSIGKHEQQPYHQASDQLEPPERFQENPVHMQYGPPYHEKLRENDAFDQSFWHGVPATEPTVFASPISPQSYFHPNRLEAEMAKSYAHPHSGTVRVPNPILIQKEIDSAALASYPSAYYPPSPPEHHVVYHQPAPVPHNYHPPSGFAQVDFSPIFLAIVPIALFLGAAAAFALATATSSSSAAAAVSQQQQQQAESSNNNAANNNNANNNNALLAALFAALQNNKHDDHDHKQKIIIITTTAEPTTEPSTALPAVLKKLPLRKQLSTLQPGKPLLEEDDAGDGLDQPGGGTVLEPPLLEEEAPEILTYDL